MLDIDGALALVRRVQTAFDTGVGDCRSNEVILELLSITKQLLARHISRQELAEAFPLMETPANGALSPTTEMAELLG